jgi:aryl-alcohol dehydrogenase-like predicted oxidoreductase
MDFRNVGRSGLRVSAIGLGCNNFGWTIDADTSRPVVHKALDLGVTLFDTADYYGSPPGNSEEVLGSLIEVERQRIVLTTKFGIPLTGSDRTPNNSRGFVVDAIEGSLRRLKTDYIDIYMIHWPDPKTAMDETLRALDDIVRSGKARYIACSNLAPWRIVDANWIAREIGTGAFIAAQDEYNLLNRNAERDLLPALSSQGMALIPYYPLASGLLTGKYLEPGAKGRLEQNFLNLGNRMLTPQNIERVQQLSDYAKQQGHSLLELAMSWIAGRPGVASVIAGATKPEQLEQNVAATGWILTDEELAAVDQILA